MDPHTVEYTLKSKPPQRLSAANIVIAVGGRPSVPSDVPGALEHAITSDDIFYLEKAPGKTLCVGASYISLECAGFLTELGYDVTVASRTILLRGFDRQCAEKVGNLMHDLGTNFMYGFQPATINKLPSGKLQVVFSNHASGVEKVEEYDTVLYATGRTADLPGLNLNAAGVNISQSGMIPVVDECTNVPHIYAIGDVCEGKPELTPVAIRAGELLAKRLFGHSQEKMDYELIPTTVFTPFEYGCVGLSEEQAVERFGADDVEVYLTEFTTLEISAVHRMKDAAIHGENEDMGHTCMSKLVCVKSQGERVVGFHCIGPNAGEITQGFTLGIRLGAKKSDFDSLVSIHPTDAESFCALSVTKRSGLPYSSEGCGGGTCG